MGTFSVDPAGLRAGAGRFRAEGAALAQAVGRLRGRLGGLATLGGDDEAGRRFDAGYEPAARTLVGNLAALAQALEAAGVALAEMAANYEAAEAASALPSGRS